MTELRHVCVDGFLGLTATAAWIGAIGMWRMPHAIQRLQYMALPAAIGSVTLAAAVASQTGATQATAKCALIALVLITFNGIITHASARAFRVREVGHWEPRPGDDVEWLGEKPNP